MTTLTQSRPNNDAWSSRGPSAPWIAAGVVLIIAASAAILYAMGRVPICACGYVKFWHGQVISSENSQHVSDWYTFTHVTHGFIFYAVATFLRRGLWIPLSFGVALLGATGVEALWEIIENTDMVIQRYRDATIALDYYGDSVLNSICDILAMIAGFFLARWLPVGVSLGLNVLSEALLALVIRDNLLLNIIMLIYPLQSIKLWQSGG